MTSSKKMNKYFNKKEWLRFFETIQRKYQEAEVTNSSVVIAYYLLLSFFPIVIIIGNLLPLLNLDINTILPYFSTIIPEAIYKEIVETIHRLLTSSSSGMLSFGIVAAFWAASKGMNAMQVSMNKAYGVEPRKNMFVIRLASLAFTLILVLGIVALVLVFSFGQVVLNYLTPLLQLPEELVAIFQSVKWPVTLFVLLFVFTLVYYMVPNAQVKVKFVLPGAIFATIGWVLLSQAFAIYVRYFSGRTLSYGSVGIFIVLMLWLNGSGIVLTLGAVINASIDEFRHGKIENNSSRIGDYFERQINKGKDKFANKK
ncbi:YihY/virulence factor BrkB family protein [Carnobacterium maltaromaticum]|uniref:YihY/virulence factor BrkB family protein n=1 Tax=Carnobacterium maltaromaticum TaxID=2751 RepID=UPI000C77A96D|nr:YihY/virulence factor BrkB family protein [Carnobacterium maltaromaticum]PLS36759.1 YihY/virulence factor BrkB family protein [Carnobacterium maltaromaticum]PLS37574.1 YihY/virulence factor BrkB family protein [Carnobacterium maltaromaticum]PLS39516.1 YihY/virulence factor BrkB family protein [Carnobacterium maltaromaticum]PLS44271.1 YihY/virulence factor BrkB family protein [Carnobacterium maltaromaticum]PLS46305.1 YihY/virulence factor BrkB family protein [Carnobacterium maltaromaticum]